MLCWTLRRSRRSLMGLPRDARVVMRGGQLSGAARLTSQRAIDAVIVAVGDVAGRARVATVGLPDLQASLARIERRSNRPVIPRTAGICEGAVRRHRRSSTPLEPGHDVLTPRRPRTVAPSRSATARPWAPRDQ